MLPLILAIVFISLGAISLVFFLSEKTKRYSLKATLIKATCSLLFIATASISVRIHSDHVLPLYVLLGLTLGLLGDIFLDFKYVYKEHDKPYSYAGFLMFGLGHILYISGLFHEFYHGENILYVILPFVGGIIVALLTIILEKPMKLKYGEMKLSCGLYAITLFSMALSSLSLCIMTSFQNITLIMFFIGGVLFAVSDLILSGTYFGVGKERPVDIITNAVTYYAAQYLIAFSIYFL